MGTAEGKGESADLLTWAFVGALVAVVSGGMITPVLLASSLMSMAVGDVLYVFLQG